MRRVEYTGQFRKDVKRIQRRGKDIDQLKLLMRLLVEGSPLPEHYQDHPLKGQWIGVRDAHIKGDWLLLYSLTEADTVVRFERTGSHSDLFDE